LVSIKVATAGPHFAKYDNKIKTTEQVVLSSLSARVRVN